MKKALTQQLAEVMKHLYISPLEQCNLNCRMCYTNKTKARLTKEAMLDFIGRYADSLPLQTITFCGGEAFLLPDFPDLVNALTPKYFVQIITNGSIDVLHKITKPDAVNLIVSLDGLPDYHDLNRGSGRWLRSTAFLKHALHLGFKVEVFSIVTKENLKQVDQFEALLQETLGEAVPVTYHPRKPMTYLTRHPVSNRLGTTDNFSFPDENDRQRLGQTKHIFPPLSLGCYQIALMSDGRVYGCCEGIRPVGTMTDPIPTLVTAMSERLTTWEQRYPDSMCLGCTEPEFNCGLEVPCR